MNKIAFIVLIGAAVGVIFLFLPFQARSQQLKAGLFVEKSDSLPYQLIQPKNIKAGEKLPLIVFLHGSGERGNDNQKQLVHGSQLFLNAQKDSAFRSIVLFPQCAEQDYWVQKQKEMDDESRQIFTFYPDMDPTPSMRLLIALIDSLSKSDVVDQDRIYVGGLSMGGMGTFELLFRRPELFAAAFPICGAYDPVVVPLYNKQLHAWIFHGSADDVVLPEYSENMAKAMKKAGIEVKLKIYPGVNHGVWDSVFAEPDLLPWLYSHSKQE